MAKDEDTLIAVLSRVFVGVSFCIAVLVQLYLLCKWCCTHRNPEVLNNLPSDAEMPRDVETNTELTDFPAETDILLNVPSTSGVAPAEPDILVKAPSTSGVAPAKTDILQNAPSTSGLAPDEARISRRVPPTKPPRYLFCAAEFDNTFYGAAAAGGEGAEQLPKGEPKFQLKCYVENEGKTVQTEAAEKNNHAHIIPNIVITNPTESNSSSDSEDPIPPYYNVARSFPVDGEVAKSIDEKMGKNLSSSKSTKNGDKEDEEEGEKEEDDDDIFGDFDEHYMADNSEEESPTNTATENDLETRDVQASN